MPAIALTAAEKSAVYLNSTGADASASEGRHVRLFRNGANQAVRIPREFEFAAQEVVMKRVGNTLVLEPVTLWPQRGSAAALRLALHEIQKLGPCDETFPDVDEGMLPLDDIDLNP